MILFLKSNDNQFRFKRNHGCTTAIYTVRKIIDKYLNGGNTVNVCAIDISKAFGKTNHHGLSLKLMKRLTPTPVVNILFYWLSNCWSCVKWDGYYSAFFKLDFGVRLGSVLSPVLFAIYLNDIYSEPTSVHAWFSVIMYADDILLICPSVRGLQQLFSHCELELHCLDMTINVKVVLFPNRSTV